VSEREGEAKEIMA